MLVFFPLLKDHFWKWLTLTTKWFINLNFTQNNLRNLSSCTQLLFRLKKLTSFVHLMLLSFDSAMIVSWFQWFLLINGLNKKCQKSTWAFHLTTKYTTILITGCPLVPFEWGHLCTEVLGRINKCYWGSGCGSVGWAVASHTRGPRFESSHRQKLINIEHLYTVNCVLKRQK